MEQEIIVKATVVATTENQSGKWTRLRFGRNGGRIGLFRFLDVDGNHLKIGQKVLVRIAELTETENTENLQASNTTEEAVL